MATGLTDLDELLRGLAPVLDERRYVFVALDGDAEECAARAFAVIREAEGSTVVLPCDDALPSAWRDRQRFARITLQVHSSLSAVGLTAAVSAALADAAIPANMIAGYYHDHVLVPEHLAASALATLETLSRAMAAIHE